jgi:hypothetical protein
MRKRRIDQWWGGDGAQSSRINLSSQLSEGRKQGGMVVLRAANEIARSAIHGHIFAEIFRLGR